MVNRASDIRQVKKRRQTEEMMKLEPRMTIEFRIPD
jgi:hypothetical protein